LPCAFRARVAAQDQDDHVGFLPLGAGDGAAVDAAAARTALLAEFAEDPGADRLDPPLRRRDRAPPDLRLPTGHSWPRIPGVTLIGDAAHLMSPFAGEGANAAMRDGCELALALVEHGDDVEAALREYETAMFPRSADAARLSARGLDLCFADDSPRGMVVFGRIGVPVISVGQG
jgi:2-polyprenyl-6-methoxyphenol hydroxylase-like FAD-dependent oxidoreductase